MFRFALDLFGAVFVMAVIAVDLVAMTQALSDSPMYRLRTAAICGAWVGVAVLLGATGRLSFAYSRVPLLGLLFVIPLLAGGVLALTSEKVREALFRVPLGLLIGLNATRILGVLFLLGFAAGTLSGPFPFFAGLGDIVAGVAAIPLARRVLRGEDIPASTIAIWNAFGALDLVVAISLGVTSATGSALQLIHTAVGSRAMQYLPLSLVPTVLVPFYLMTHAVVAAKLSRKSRSLARNASVAATQA